MHVQGPGRHYYRLLDFVARFLQSDGVSAQWRIGLLAAAGAVLLGLAWALANGFVLQAGELPGTAAYDRLLFSYLMRMVCGASLVVGGVLLSTLWAQQAGRIPQYAPSADAEGD